MLTTTARATRQAPRRRTAGATTTYSYDGNGNLTGASGGRSLSLSYNAKNQTTAINGTALTYTGSDQTERTQAGTTSYVNTPLGVSSQTDTSGATYYTRDNRGRLVSERTATGTSYYLFDGLGSVMGLADGSGNLVASYTYDPYGTVTSSSGAQAASNPWRFQSGYADSFSGLDKFGTRYDDATLGRWTQQDPVGGSLGNPNSLDRYVCTQDNPVNLTDPSGALSCGGAIAVGALIAVGTGIAVAGAVFIPVLDAAVLGASLASGFGLSAVGTLIGSAVGVIGGVDAITSSCYNSPLF